MPKRWIIMGSQNMPNNVSGPYDTYDEAIYHAEKNNADSSADFYFGPWLVIEAYEPDGQAPPTA